MNGDQTHLKNMGEGMKIIERWNLIQKFFYIPPCLITVILIRSLIFCMKEVYQIQESPSKKIHSCFI